MSGLLNVGTRALQANQVALQTAGNNIANVNTAGYSRQNVVLQTVQGQYTGGGYIGKGVAVETIQRNFSAFLTRQSAVATATASADATRSTKLQQLESIFSGGSTGLGAAVNDMLNAFSDVASAPSDLTARTVALTRVDETAARMRSASRSLDDLQQGVTQELTQKASAVNTLAQNIADVNGQIARAQGSGQPPNDLLDRRDQLVRELNVYVQTTSIPADDGTMGIFIGGSQALVLGTSASTLNISATDGTYSDALKSKLTLTRDGQTTALDENTLGGGEIPGLLRFQNSDLAEGRNLLGRLTLAISYSMNEQHQLGLDLDGNKGGNLFTTADLGLNNILEPAPPAPTNTGLHAASVTLGVSDPTKFEASDYELVFTSSTAGAITRKSDGVVTAFTFTPGNSSQNGSFAFNNPVTHLNDLASIDGLELGTLTSSSPVAGDRLLLKPFSTTANNIQSTFSTPRALAVASPVVGSMGVQNKGSLQQSSLQARSNATPLVDVPLTLTFTSATQYIRSDDPNFNNYASGASPQPEKFNYTAGQVINSAIGTGTPGWSVTLQGSPVAGDTFSVADIKNNPSVDLKLNSGNASAMMGLRDVAMFDGAALTDGYAGLIAQIGIRAQSANYASEVSSSIASNLEQERAGVSGVNLDEEAAKLLQFQQAYQASAKMIQIAQGIFDTLIQTMGR
jgi:flagellar hook-associated protein 1 FlgK